MTVFKIVIEEPPQRCEGCGIIAETRPYGLNHEEICTECSEKDPALTEIRMKQFYLGEQL